MNRVVLIGRLTKEPELYYTKQGVAYARICVAVNRGFRNSLGEQQVDFINCVVWRKSAENVTKYCKKDHSLGLQGVFRLVITIMNKAREYIELKL